MVDVSILMCVYNTDKEMLKEAVDSVINQNFDNWEFVIVDDASTDVGTKSVLQEASKEQKVKIITNSQNIGLTKSLNIGLKECHGRYIARIDSDDVAMNDRIKCEFDFLERNKEYSIVCSRAKYIGDKRADFHKFTNYMSNPEKFKMKMLFINVGPIHSTAMIRKEFLDENELKYDENYSRAQDYKLWVDCLKFGARFACLDRTTIEYRLHDKQISAKHDSEQSECARDIAINHIMQEMSVSISEASVLSSLYSEKFEYSITDYINVIKKCKKNNRTLLRYNIKDFDREMSIRWTHKVIKCCLKGNDSRGLLNLYTLKTMFCGGLLFEAMEKALYR